jgi:N-formylglutamate amidohydrolase
MALSKVDIARRCWHILAMNENGENNSPDLDFRPHEMGVETVSPARLLEPVEHTSPLVLSSPHSGRHYPEHFLAASRLDHKTLRASEDYYIDDLFSPSVQLGVPLLAAEFPRAYVDLNREPYELDQRMFADRLPGHANTRSVRVAGGLGTVARVVSENREIYQTALGTAEAFDRIDHVYRPWHEVLRKLLARTHVAFGRAVLIDCHSMPSGQHSTRTRRKAIPVVDRANRADFILGDRYGTSCSGELAEQAQTFLRALGYKVVRNKPYAGGFITEHYGRPAKGLHALQIEINRSLYVNEETLEKNGNFQRLQADLLGLINHLSAVALDIHGETLPLAAE